MKKGNLLMSVILSTIVAVMCVTLLMQSMRIRQYADSASGKYPDELTLRAVSEIAAYQFAVDLQSVSVTNDLRNEWLSSLSIDTYKDCLEQISGYIVDAENKWVSSNMSSMISGVDFSNEKLTKHLIESIDGAELSVYLEDSLSFNWSGSNNSETDSSALVELNPVLISVSITQKGIKVNEEFTISGLYMDYASDGSTSSARLCGDEIEIYRSIKV